MRNFRLATIGLSALMLASCDGSATSNPVFEPVPANVSSVGVDTIPGQILVDMKDNVSESDIKELADSVGITLSESNDVAHEYKYEAADVDPAKEDSVIARLQSDSRVEHAEPMTKYHALFMPNDPMYKDQWGMHRVGVESSYGMSCGAGVKVAVVDTGVRCMEAKGVTRLSDLAKCESGYDFTSNKPIANDGNLHGSHVSGTIAQSTHNNLGGVGVAPCATILPVKVLSDSGSGTSEGVASGIRYAVDQGAQVINMSLGSDSPSDVIKDAVNYAHDKGVTVVCAAGNSGSKTGFPAGYKNAISVSAIDQNDTIAKFSSRGKIEVAAPGVGILQQTICEDDPKSDGCYMSLNGTSMASPFSAGVASLIVSSGITDPDAVRAKMQSTADKKDDAKLYGAGIVRADSAVRSTLLSHAFMRVLALFGILFFMRKSIKTEFVKSKLSMLGVVLGGFGVLPIAFLSILPRLGAFRIVGEVLMRPVAEWDILFGMHKYMTLESFIPATVLSLLLLGHNKARLFSGGFALGAASLATQAFISNDQFFVGGSFMMRALMAVTTVVCVYFAKAAFTAKKV